MSEHRTLFGSLGITLIGIGLAGYVSLQVSGAVAGHPVKLGPTDHLCIGLITAGSVLFVLVCLSLLHQWFIKMRISLFTAQGIGLLDDARQVPANDPEALKDIHNRYWAWVAEVRKWLMKHDVGAAVHFGNEAGRLVTEGLMGGSISSQIDTRLARLAELSVKRL